MSGVRDAHWHDRTGEKKKKGDVAYQIVSFGLCLVLFFFCKMNSIVLSFIFDKYCLIMD